MDHYYAVSSLTNKFVTNLPNSIIKSLLYLCFPIVLFFPFLEIPGINCSHYYQQPSYVATPMLMYSSYTANPVSNEFMPEYFCGIDAMTKIASLLIAGVCPKDKCLFLFAFKISENTFRFSFSQ